MEIIDSVFELLAYELAAIFAVLSIGLFLRHHKKIKRVNTTAEKLVKKLKRNQEKRRGEISKVLEERFGLQEDALEQLAREMQEQEQQIYKQILKIYIDQDDKTVLNFPQQLEAFTDAHLALQPVGREQEMPAEQDKSQPLEVQIAQTASQLELLMAQFRQSNSDATGPSAVQEAHRQDDIDDQDMATAKDDEIRPEIADDTTEQGGAENPDSEGDLTQDEDIDRNTETDEIELDVADDDTTDQAVAENPDSEGDNAHHDVPEAASTMAEDELESLLDIVSDGEEGIDLSAVDEEDDDTAVKKSDSGVEEPDDGTETALVSEEEILAQMMGDRVQSSEQDEATIQDVAEGDKTQDLDEKAAAIEEDNTEFHSEQQSVSDATQSRDDTMETDALNEERITDMQSDKTIASHDQEGENKTAQHTEENMDDEQSQTERLTEVLQERISPNQTEVESELIPDNDDRLKAGTQEREDVDLTEALLPDAPQTEDEPEVQTSLGDGVQDLDEQSLPDEPIDKPKIRIDASRSEMQDGDDVSKDKDGKNKSAKGMKNFLKKNWNHDIPDVYGKTEQAASHSATDRDEVDNNPEKEHAQSDIHIQDTPNEMPGEASSADEQIEAEPDDIRSESEPAAEMQDDDTIGMEAVDLSAHTAQTESGSVINLLAPEAVPLPESQLSPEIELDLSAPGTVFETEEEALQARMQHIIEKDSALDDEEKTESESASTETQFVPPTEALNDMVMDYTQAYYEPLPSENEFNALLSEIRDLEQDPVLRQQDVAELAHPDEKESEEDELQAILTQIPSFTQINKK